MQKRIVLAGFSGSPKNQEFANSVVQRTIEAIARKHHHSAQRLDPDVPPQHVRKVLEKMAPDYVLGVFFCGKADAEITVSFARGSARTAEIVANFIDDSVEAGRKVSMRAFTAHADPLSQFAKEANLILSNAGLRVPRARAAEMIQRMVGDYKQKGMLSLSDMTGLSMAAILDDPKCDASRDAVALSVLYESKALLFAQQDGSFIPAHFVRVPVIPSLENRPERLAAGLEKAVAYACENL